MFEKLRLLQAQEEEDDDDDDACINLGFSESFMESFFEQVGQIPWLTGAVNLGTTTWIYVPMEAGFQ